MMDDDLPTEYDVIVVGTGMTESILAAAASRVGKKVLHLDGNEYYGGLWASFNFDGLQKWMEECRQPWKTVNNVTDDTKALLKEGEVAVGAGNQFSTISNIQEKWYILEETTEPFESQSMSKRTQTDTEEGAKESGDAGTGSAKADSVEGDDVSAPTQRKQWSQSRVKKEYRKFNLDLAPKLLFARGSLVELLISSNIARYAEFRSVTRVLTWLDGRLELVPCSRADVFSTDHISVAEKRMLMKLMTACMEQENYEKEFEEYAARPFVEYLQSKKLTSNLIHYVLHAIAMVTEKTVCLEGVTRTQRFLNSLGRYGNTPFLWPMYGSGELPQCFCRLCAVFGGLYHLKRSADALIVKQMDSGKAHCAGIVSGNQRLDASNLVMGVGYAPASFVQDAPTGGLSRAIFITDRSILPADKESLTLLNFPAVDGVEEPATVIEIGPSTNACPQGLYVVHITCKQRSNAQEDIRNVMEHLLHMEFDDGTVNRVNTDTQSTQTVSGTKKQGEKAEAMQPSKQSATALKPQILWSLYFNCPETSSCDLSNNVPDNVFLCSGPDLDLDFEFAVKQAKEIFSKMYPDCEFLPRAPDPEEIVLEGDDDAKTEDTTNETTEKEE